MRRVKHITVGKGRTRLELDLYEVGKDLVGHLGGEGPHVGAASLAERLHDGSLQLETLRASGHREDELTVAIAKALTTASGRRALVFAGIHLDGISREEIESIRSNTKALSLLLQAEAWDT